MHRFAIPIGSDYLLPFALVLVNFPMILLQLVGTPDFALPFLAFLYDLTVHCQEFYRFDILQVAVGDLTSLEELSHLVSD